MPRFILRGADRQSGEELAWTIDAKNRIDAEKQATDAGMMVSEVEFDPTPPPPPESVEYAAPAPTAQVRVAAPEYQAIGKGAWWLNLMGFAVAVMGWLYLAGAGFLFVSVAATATRNRYETTVEGVLYAVAALTGAAFLLGVAAVLRMLGAAGLALRDIAQNSFR